MLTLTFQFSDIAAAAALLAKLNGHEIGAMVPPAAPSPVVLTDADALADLKGEPRPDHPKAAVAQPGKSKRTSAATTAAPAPTPPTAEADAETAAPAKTAAAPASSTAASAEAQPQASTAADAPTASYQDAATAITKLSRTKGRDVAVALLGKFGAAKLPDVKPEQFAAVIAACDEAMQ